MYVIGQRVRHKRTGKLGTIEMFNQTYFPTIKKTHYQLLVKSDDEREWNISDRLVDVIPENHDDAIPVQPATRGRSKLFKS